MGIRITGGKFRGRIIPPPPGKTRPTSSMLRQALFDILGDIENLSFCDLFAGSGIVGIEAASREASPITFVESDKICAKNIKSFLTDFSLEPETKVFNLPVARWLKSSQEKFDIIFADPPYIENVALDLFEDIENILERLNESGIFVLQLSKKITPPEHYSSARKFGDDILYFWGM